MLKNHYYEDFVEAGCDEAGRGCLAGSVFAAAVILPRDYENELLNDSKKLTDHKRKLLRTIIERDAVAWAVGIVTPEEIDRINILNASILAMHRALDGLKVRPEAVIVDGNRFKPYRDLPHTTLVKGDGNYMSIAAASILAKTYRAVNWNWISRIDKLTRLCGLNFAFIGYNSYKNVKIRRLKRNRTFLYVILHILCPPQAAQGVRVKPCGGRQGTDIHYLKNRYEENFYSIDIGTLCRNSWRNGL